MVVLPTALLPMQEKPRLSFWQIWNMSFGFMGIQFGWGLQMANMSSIYQFLGADEAQIPILWLAAPLTGLIIQPIVGYCSDRTWTCLGRRRPYFLVGAVFASLALIAMPNSPSLWVAAGLLWILDASVNISMEPFRAFVGDLLPKDQRKNGFAMQALLIGMGAVLSSALPFVLTNGFGVGREATVESPIPPAVKLAFYIGAGVFLSAVLVTILTTREYPPENLEEFKRLKREQAGVGHAFREILDGIVSMPGAMKRLALVQFFTWLALFSMWIYFVPAVGKKVFGGIPLGVKGEVERALVESDGGRWLSDAVALASAYEKKKKELAIQAVAQGDGTPRATSFLQMLGLTPAAPDPGERIDAGTLASLIRECLDTGRVVSDKERESPLVMSFALALASHQVDGPEAPGVGPASLALHDSLASARRYQEGAAWGGVCFSVYNLVAFGFSFVLLGLTRVFSAKRIHGVCLMAGALGLCSASFVDQASMLLVSMVGVGVAWASILSMPYAMLANVIASSRMGFYMGVFNFFIVLPQILAALVLGKVVDWLLGGDAMTAVLTAAAAMALAVLAMVWVKEDAETGKEATI